MARSRSADDRPGDGSDRAEVDKFAALAAEWWDADGPFRPLHRLNPVRLRFLRDRIAAHHGRDPLGPAPLAGLSLVDVGCGGGLLAEPLARLGARVTGIDAAAESIEVARSHAAQAGVAVTYRQATAAELAAEGLRFDAVVSMEVVEHVPDPAAFLAACAALTAPGGAIALATLNRTPKSFAFAVLGAEYLLGWLPRGSHDWHRFVRPSELARALRAGGIRVEALVGVVYKPLGGGWGLGDDLGVNYMAFGTRPLPA